MIMLRPRTSRCLKPMTTLCSPAHGQSHPPAKAEVIDPRDKAAHVRAEEANVRRGRRRARRQSARSDGRLRSQAGSTPTSSACRPRASRADAARWTDALARRRSTRIAHDLKGMGATYGYRCSPHRSPPRSAASSKPTPARRCAQRDPSLVARACRCAARRRARRHHARPTTRSAAPLLQALEARVAELGVAPR